MPEPLNLPQPSTRTLSNAPLALVVCQVQHARNPAVGEPERILATHASLDGPVQYPQLEQLAQQAIEIVGQGIGAPVASEQQLLGWRASSPDGSWVVALLPDSFSLECTRYTSWSEFRARFSALLHAISQHLQPQLALRIGLRYVDNIPSQFDDPRHWEGEIEGTAMGLLAHPALGSAIEGTQQVTQLLGRNEMRVILRTTTFPTPEGPWSYVIDTDCYKAGAGVLTPEAVLPQLEELHTLSLQIFQSITTEPLRLRLGGGRNDS